MIEWSTEILRSSQHSLAVFPAALLLGIMGSATSCCSLPVFGAIAAYSGTVGHDTDRRPCWSLRCSSCSGLWLRSQRSAL